MAAAGGGEIERLMKLLLDAKAKAVAAANAANAAKHDSAINRKKLARIAEKAVGVYANIEAELSRVRREGGAGSSGRAPMTLEPNAAPPPPVGAAAVSMRPVKPESSAAAAASSFLSCPALACMH